jgi:hypothetical protein
MEALSQQLWEDKLRSVFLMSNRQDFVDLQYFVAWKLLIVPIVQFIQL